MRRLPAVGLTVILSSACSSTENPVDAEYNETGYFEYDFGSGEIENRECLGTPRPGAWGYKYQCTGLVTGQIKWTYDSVEVNHSIPFVGGVFGAPQSYEEASVIACCGEFDDEQSFSDQPEYAHYCQLDMIEQICRTFAYGLGAQIKDDMVAGPQRSAARDVQKYIAANIQTCVNTFMAEWPPTSPNMWVPYSALDGEWNLPGGQDYSTEFTNVQVTFTSIVTDVSAPVPPETCTDLSSNDNEIIPSVIEPLDTDLDIYLENADGDFIGPVYGGTQITGSADFASDMTACTDPKCSRASISYDAYGAFSIDRMSLYLDGTLIISNGGAPEVISDGRVELLTPAAGTWSVIGGDNVYEIQSGDAEFVVVGQADGDFATLAVTLTSPITATELAGEWTFDAFTLTFTDDSSNVWTADVGTSIWFE